MRYYLVLSENFIHKLIELRQDVNGYIAADVIFRLYFFNHEKKYFPADTEMFSKITAYDAEKIKTVISLCKKHKVLRVIDDEEYFKLQKKDFLDGTYVPPYSNKKETKALKNGFTKAELKAVIEEQPESIRKALWEYCEMRKKKKNPISARTLNSKIKRATGFAEDYMKDNGGDKEELIKELFEQSVDNGWIDIYDFKNKGGYDPEAKIRLF